MVEKRRAPGMVPGARVAAVAAARSEIDGPIVSQPRAVSSFGFACIRTLADLAEEAAVKAEVARLLADVYRTAGDLVAWRLWRRRQLAHQAIRRAALLGGER